MLIGRRRLETEWQVGDGRELALARHVEAEALLGDPDDVIRVIDDFAYHRSFLINVGDEKGKILDAAIRRTKPRQLLELGTYCGYSALRAARMMPEGARLVSIEFNAENAAIARRIWDHAGIGEELTVLVGTLGDGGATTAALESEHAIKSGSLDFVFIDHDKSAYLPDLELILDRGWLHPGSIVVADNLRWPGAPDYREFMRTEEGRSWRTTEHETHVEYQSLLKDVVLESEYLGR
jgi:catechol O-methyltransferase